MNKKKILYLDYYEEYNDGVLNYQDVINREENIYYTVSNLNERPEDAIIGRELFDANDFIGVLNLGMELAKEGYTDIKIREKKND